MAKRQNGNGHVDGVVGPATPAKKDSGMSGLAIGGIVVAVFVAGFGVYFCWKRNNNNGRSGVVASMADELL